MNCDVCSADIRSLEATKISIAHAPGGSQFFRNVRLSVAIRTGNLARHPPSRNDLDWAVRCRSEAPAVRFTGSPLA